MLIVSSREFREKQRTYLDMADNGEDVIISRGKNKSYKLIPVAENDTCASKEDFYAKIDHALQQANEGKTLRINSEEDFKHLLGL